MLRADKQMPTPRFLWSHFKAALCRVCHGTLQVRIFLQVSHRNIVQLLEVYESEVDQVAGGVSWLKAVTEMWFTSSTTHMMVRDKRGQLLYMPGIEMMNC
eukprot:5308673-Amphidinium_carterae.3